MNAPLYPMAPAPTALRRRLRRADLRRRMGWPLAALGALVLFVALIGQSLPLLILGALITRLGVRWSSTPLRSLIQRGPLELF